MSHNVSDCIIYKSNYRKAETVNMILFLKVHLKDIVCLTVQAPKTKFGPSLLFYSSHQIY